jgi:hypothetical protein
MSYSTPRVMILGRSDTKNTVMQEYLQDIQTSQIPYDFLDTVFVTFESEEKIRVNKKYLKDGIDYNNIYRDLSRLGISQNVSLVEIIIDLDAAYTQLEKKTSAYLDPLFL